jgi:hypothetical protein
VKTLNKQLLSTILGKKVEYLVMDTQDIKNKINGAIKDSEIAVY